MPHIYLLEALHGLIQLTATIYHVLKLVHTVSKDDHFAANGRVSQVLQSLLLEVGQVVLVVLLEQLNDQVLAVQFKLLFEGALEVGVLVHDGAPLCRDMVLIDDDLAEGRPVPSAKL